MTAKFTFLTCRGTAKFGKIYRDKQMPLSIDERVGYISLLIFLHFFGVNISYCLMIKFNKQSPMSSLSDVNVLQVPVLLWVPRNSNKGFDFSDIV